MITNSILLIVPIFFSILFLKTNFGSAWTLRYTIKAFLFMIFLTCLIGLTIFPIPVNEQYIQSELSKGSYNHPFNNFELFQSIKRFYYYSPSAFYFYKQIYGNVLLFVPFGFLLPALFSKQNQFLKVVFMSFFISCFIEIIQYTISIKVGFVVRVADVDDVLLNTIGGAAGYLFYQMWRYVKSYFFPGSTS